MVKSVLCEVTVILTFDHNIESVHLCAKFEEIFFKQSWITVFVRMGQTDNPSTESLWPWLLLAWRHDSMCTVYRQLNAVLVPLRSYSCSVPAAGLADFRSYPSLLFLLISCLLYFCGHGGLCGFSASFHSWLLWVNIFYCINQDSLKPPLLKKATWRETSFHFEFHR